MLLDIYPQKSLDNVMSQIVEQEVLKYLSLEHEAAKGHFIIQQLLYVILHHTIWNFVNQLTSLNAALGNFCTSA